MSRAIVTVFVVALAASCASAGTTTTVPPRVVASVSPVVPTCPFEVGDLVRRAGGGAAVPPRGQGVVGNFDGVERSGMIQIDTRTDGLVTITSRVSTGPKHVETCQLPDA
jgi:hypothetical protein